tara:strand:+ start:83 stop:568 length:486 start_codon:yes stop_codon:yes gene_type:complete
MKIPPLIKLNKLTLLIIFCPMLIGVDVTHSREKIIHSLPIKKEFNELEKQTKDLIPMPVGDINYSSLKVNFDRNPFQEPLKTEYPTIENLYSSLKFRGLAQSDKKLQAIIETVNGQKFYGVGDTLDNGFVIQLISLENVTVDISNGNKKYRLSLADIEQYK